MTNRSDIIVDGNLCEARNVHAPHGWMWYSGDDGFGMIRGECPGISEITEEAITSFCGWKINHKPHEGRDLRGSEILFKCPGYEYDPEWPRK